MTDYSDPGARPPQRTNPGRREPQNPYTDGRHQQDRYPVDRYSDRSADNRYATDRAADDRYPADVYPADPYGRDRPAPRRRRWPIVVPIVALVALAGGWVAAWNYAAAQSQSVLEAWRAREAQAGRIYTCERQSVGGFPFRFEVTCERPSAEFRTNVPPITLRFAAMVARAGLATPTTFTTEFVGPLLIEPAGQPALQATWTHAEAQVRGVPTAPQGVAITLDNAVFSRIDGAAAVPLMQGERMALDAAMASGSIADRPVIDIKLQLAKVLAPMLADVATTPELQSLIQVPVDFEAAATVRGLRDLAPKPAPVALREWQANGGRVEITRARIQQADILGQASGRVGLSPRGALDGDLALVMANFEKLVPALGIDRMMQQSMSQNNLSRMGLGALDRLMPGLSNALQNNAGQIAQAGLGMLGRPTELEGRKALAVPLRFTDGDVLLGPLRVAQVPPVF